MTPETYSELLKDLQKLEKRLVPAYLETLRADTALTAKIQARFIVAEVGGHFDDFAVLCCRRSAVQFLLRTVYVRVLEDLGALKPPRIRGEWGLAAFREVAPALGVREFFNWTFRDLACDFPALFTPGPEELPLPSGDLCLEVWGLWHRMSGDRPHFVWVSDSFDSRFLGDLYQHLDAEVRKRFALLQTPEFVEKYILDHTLTPAIAEFDPAELRASGGTFRLIDPTCGSGHFLIGAFHRLADYWQANGVEDPWEATEHALVSVWGCDINPHAVDIARFRLMLEVRARTGVAQLERLASLTLNLEVMDSLIPWERGATNQGDLFPAMDRLSVYATPGERAVNAAFLAPRFHVVVGNPPYIKPLDPKKSDDYRLFWPDSASGKYVLAVPFVERFTTLGVPNAYTGQITSNSFMKRSFGARLVSTYFGRHDLTLVVDTSSMRIQGHGTSTVLLFVRNRTPTTDRVSALVGKRGDPPAFRGPTKSLVWAAILAAETESSDGDNGENPYISRESIDRKSLSVHPWAVTGQVAKQILNEVAEKSVPLRSRVRRIGNLTKTIRDEIYFDPPPSARRDPACNWVVLLEGAYVRDWTIDTRCPEALYPYPKFATNELLLGRESPAFRYLWRFRTDLESRLGVGFKTIKERGIPFYAYPFHAPYVAAETTLTLPEVSTHNHFVVSHGNLVFKQTAPCIRFHGNLDLETIYDTLGALNSSVIEFWTRINFQPKGGDKGSDGTRASEEEWSDRIQRDAKKMYEAPLALADRDARIRLARALEATARERIKGLPHSVLARKDLDPARLAGALAQGRERYRELTHEMVALQEELDWLSYGSYKLIDPAPSTVEPADIEPLAPGHRPFEILFARADDDAADDEKSAWWSRHGHDRVTEIPPNYSEAMRARIQARMDLIESEPKLQLIERATYKRRWQSLDLDVETRSAAESYLLDRLEDLFAPDGPLANPKPYRLEQIVDAWTRDSRTVAVAQVWKGGDVDLTLAAEQLLRAHALPDNPRRVYSAEGLRHIAHWKRIWHLQDLEDQDMPLIDPDTGERLDAIGPPPKFERGHFLSADTFAIRGKLDVPRERFIFFGDLSPPRYGWNGWRDADRARAQVEAYTLAEGDPQDPLPSPTAADPRRCGPTLGLWESLPDVRRWDSESTHAEFLALAQEVCGQKSCPCAVVDVWQAAQTQKQSQTGAKRRGRKARLPVVPPSAEVVTTQLPANPDAIAVTVEDRAFVFRLIEPFGEGGATLVDLTRSWGRDPAFLARILDDLLASGDLKTRGRGKRKIYIAAAIPRT